MPKYITRYWKNFKGTKLEVSGNAGRLENSLRLDLEQIALPMTEENRSVIEKYCIDQKWNYLLANSLPLTHITLAVEATAVNKINATGKVYLSITHFKPEVPSQLEEMAAKYELKPKGTTEVKR